ncbi:hypothetical protein ROHU_010228 [Labeo rohita]|uniref:Uncharacterized protein n=1 Tax=Labeo rohita TaxID=84645 RepID=A0A498LXM5_LABRO|nr:hypothetical protein ROHU_010228 [Labeo rohita]
MVSESSDAEFQSWISFKVSSKKAEAEAELAAKVEQAKAMQEIHEQQAKLRQMENDWKLREAKMLTEIKEKEAVMCLRIEEERTKLEQLNAAKSYIPTKKTALQWPHLKRIAHEMPPLQSCDIGMLIGYDCPSALAPLEVITGGDDEPFAQKTNIGWSIIGLCNPHLDRQGNQSFVHQLSVKEVLVPSANDVLKVLESDFNEIEAS